MSLSQAATEFLTGRPAGVSAVSRTVAGLLSTWVENGFNCTVRRDPSGLPYELVAERAGRGIRLVQGYTFAGGVLAGMTGDTIPTVMRSEVMTGGTFGSSVSGGGAWGDPITLDSTSPVLLTKADHANRLIIVDSATAVTLSVQSDVLGGCSGDDSFTVYSRGAGTVTVTAAGSATLRAPSGSASSVTQYKLAEFVRTDVNTFTAVTPAASGGSGITVYQIRGTSDYTLTAVSTSVLSQTIPANMLQTGSLLRINCAIEKKTGAGIYNIRIKFGAQTMRASLGVSATASRLAVLHAEMYHVTNAAQLSQLNTGMAAFDTAATSVQITTYAIDTTVAQNVEVFLDGTAGDTVRVHSCIIEAVNPS